MHANNGAPNVIESDRPVRPAPGLEIHGTSTEHAPLRLPVTTRVTEAREALYAAGEEIALVTELGVDVGVVTTDDLVSHGSQRATVIGDVMNREVVCISPSTDLTSTVRAYIEAAWSSAIRRRPGARTG